MSKADELMKQINKMLGAGTVRMGNDDRFKVTYTPTGLLPFDVAFQGGLPVGRFVVVTGNYSTLKSYLGLHAIKEVQKAGGVAALIDTERAFDPEWAESLGVDIQQLIIERPENGELAIDVAEVLTRAKVNLIVFDSVAATLPQQEQTKRLHGEHIQPGRQAALFSAACRRLTAANEKTAYLWINQLRESIGVTFGNPEKAPAGRALPYYASIILNIKAAGKITRPIKMFTGDKDTATKEQIGQTFRAVIEKSKLNRPWREVYFDYNLLTSQLDVEKFVFAQGVDLGLVTKKGNTWQYKDVKAVGRDAFLRKLAAVEETYRDLENAVRTEHGLSPLPGPRATAKKKAGASKAKSSSSKVSGRTLAPARGRSLSTGRRLAS